MKSRSREGRSRKEGGRGKGGGYVHLCVPIGQRGTPGVPLSHILSCLLEIGSLTEPYLGWQEGNAGLLSLPPTALGLQAGMNMVSLHIVMRI